MGPLALLSLLSGVLLLSVFHSGDDTDQNDTHPDDTDLLDERDVTDPHPGATFTVSADGVEIEVPPDATVRLASVI